MENTELQTTVKKQADRIKQLQENLLGIRSVSQPLNLCHTDEEEF